jgi:ferritin-like metal-binding protein YciE
LKSWAAKLGMGRAVLDQTLSEERKTDETLSKIATTTVNVQAA